jgi:hypothetical protein
MPRDADGPTRPKCLFCKERREGQRHQFWGGYHVATHEEGGFLSDTTTITSTYRDIKPVGAFVCHPCARRIVFRASILTIIVSTAAAVGCMWMVIAVGGESAWLRWTFTAFVVLAALIAFLYAVTSLCPNLDLWSCDKVIRDKAPPLLKKKKKGDTFFTEREYEVLFRETGSEGHETAEELLEGIEDDDWSPRRGRGR